MTKRRYVGPDHPEGRPAYIEDPNQEDVHLPFDEASDEVVTAAIAELRVEAAVLLDEADRLEACLRKRQRGRGESTPSEGPA
jgi:hypothetical protein